MDARLRIDDAPRPGAPDALAELPLATIAWRSLRAEYAGRAEERRRQDKALVAIAEETFRLRRALRPAPLAEDGPPEAGAGPADALPAAGELAALAGRLERALGQLGVEILAPEGEEFAGDYMELLENIAQVPDPAAAAPRVAEVIEPAILRAGALLRMGKVVVGVPAEGRPAAAAA